MKPLSVERLTASRDGHVLLEQIKLEVRSGQVTGIIADNPDRLSFFLNILGGSEQENRGEVLFAGKPWRPRERLLRVGLATEQVSLVDTLSVLDNIYLSNNQSGTRFGFILRSKRRELAKKTLRNLGVQLDLSAPVRRLEPTTKVLLDIARVLIKAPDLYIFHSVTRSMSLRQYEAFQLTVRQLRNDGKGVLVIPLTSGDVRTLVDRLYYLQGTQLFEIEDLATLTDEQLHGFFLGTEKNRFTTSSDPILRAKHQMQDSLAAEDLDFQSLARDVGMSYDNFRRRFKAQIGQSPNQYFMAAKIEKAKEILRFTDLEIKDVARQLGFSDPYYFSRFFKERTGLSPVQFRQSE